MRPPVVATFLAMEEGNDLQSPDTGESNPSNFADSNQGPATTCRRIDPCASASRSGSKLVFSHGHVFASSLAQFSVTSHLPW
jgi:hypothetical protein